MYRRRFEGPGSVLGVLLLLLPCVASAASQVDPQLFSAMKWRQIGPFRGGRAVAVSGVPGDPATWYFGAVAGGVWKSTNAGSTWQPVFDEQKIASIGAIAVADSDHNIIYVGTGEACPRGNITYGDGVYKSVDAGRTWKNMGLKDTRQIGALIVHPKNPDIVLVAALGHAFGPNDERGVFRSADGGQTWTRVLYKDRDTGAIDVVFDPDNPNVVYASLWQMRRQPWNFSSGGPGSGLYKSTDAGVTWKRLEGHGLPHSPVGRIAVRVAKKDSNRVYAEIETGDGVPQPNSPGQLGELWRSNDGGESWEMVNSDRQLRGRTHYYTRTEIAPDNENEVFFFSASFSRTLDGGRTLTKMPSDPGGDNHEMWIDPTDGDRMAVVNDGGVNISVDRGNSWNHVNLPIAQMYHVTVDDQIPYFVYGNRQDGPSWRGPSNSLQFGGFLGNNIPRGAWHPVAGGESGFAVPDPVDNNIIWSTGTGSGSIGGTVTRFDERTHQNREVEVWPEYVAGAPAAEVKYRFNWEFPIAISPFD